MSVRIMTAVWSVRLPDSEKLVLLALADCANDEGVAWPSMKTLAEKCSKSDRTVQASIKALVAAGHLSRQETPGVGCRYWVHPSPEAASPPKRVPPETVAPQKGTTPTPEAASDKPSRTISPVQASPSQDIAEIEPILLPEHVLEVWNDVAGRLGLPKARMNDQRKRRLAVLIRNHPIDDFTDAIACVERNRWMHGENDRGWRADFDFLIQAKSFTRLVEGSYDRAAH